METFYPHYQSLESKRLRMVEYSVDNLDISLKCSYYFIHYICINVMACIRNNIIIQMVYWLKIMPTDLQSIFRTNTSRLLKVRITDNVVLFCLYSIYIRFTLITISANHSTRILITFKTKKWNRLCVVILVYWSI